MNIEDIANEVLKIIRQNGVKIEDAIVLNNPDSAKELLTLTDSGDIAKISPETLLSTILNRGMVYNGYIAEGVTIPVIENSFYLLTKEGQYTDSDGNTITIASKGLNVLTRRNNEWKVYAICRLHDSITSTDADAYLSARAGNELYEKIKDLENTSLALRKLFLAEGALYNDTDAIIKRTPQWKTEEKWQQEEDGTYTYWEEDALVDHLPEHYYLNGLGNITESEMLNIYKYKDAVTRFQYPRCCQGTTIRTFFGMWHQHGISTLAPFAYNTFYFNRNLESAMWYSNSLEGGYDKLVTVAQVTAPTEMSYTFNQCSKLKYIHPINVKNTTKPFTTTFIGCTSLKEIRLHNLKSNLILTSSSEISKRSILHAIKNATPTTAITITLHPDAYARIESQPDIIEALREKNGYVDEEGNEVAGTLPAGASINLVSA